LWFKNSFEFEVVELNLLETCNLTLEIGENRILDNISIGLPKGCIYALVGPNGAGKSTLAGVLMGLPDFTGVTGDIYFSGSRINDLGVDERAKMGMTLGWQEPARFEGISVEEFIRASAGGKDGEIASEALLTVGLDPSVYLKRDVDKTLSGGERKKVELASIVAMKPKFIILDEPDSGIDVESLDRIFDAIKYLKGQGSTVLLITHSLTVLGQAEYAFLMCKGKIVDRGEKNEIMKYFYNRCMTCPNPNEPGYD